AEFCRSSRFAQRSRNLSACLLRVFLKLTFPHARCPVAAPAVAGQKSILALERHRHRGVLARLELEPSRRLITSSLAVEEAMIISRQSRMARHSWTQKRAREECKRWGAKYEPPSDLKSKENRIGVRSCEEFYGPLNEILKRQYTVEGYEGLLLSPRGKYDEDGAYVCRPCRDSLSREHTVPPKFAIANGFFCGHLPEEIDGLRFEATEGDQWPRRGGVAEALTSDVLCAMLNPCRPVKKLTGLFLCKPLGKNKDFEVDEDLIAFEKRLHDLQDRIVFSPAWSLGMQKIFARSVACADRVPKAVADKQGPSLADEFVGDIGTLDPSYLSGKLVLLVSRAGREEQRASGASASGRHPAPTISAGAVFHSARANFVETTRHTPCSKTGGSATRALPHHLVVRALLSYKSDTFFRCENHRYPHLSMSCVPVVDDGAEVCANCGKQGSDTVKLKNCTACRLVKYCGVDCQRAHRKQHKQACKRRAAELKDEKLYSHGHERPEGDFCPICTLPIPLPMENHSVFKNCCMKLICHGCSVAAQKRGMFDCAFCRTPLPNNDADALAMIRSRVSQKDPAAIYHLGGNYLGGKLGLQKNERRAVEFWTEAAELGSIDALYNLGVAYALGEGVEKNRAKAAEFYTKAAMQGHAPSRYNLGYFEGQRGNHVRAARHYLISAKMGDKHSLENIKQRFMAGIATKEQYAEALKGYQDALEETKNVPTPRTTERTESSRPAQHSDSLRCPADVKKHNRAYVERGVLKGVHPDGDARRPARPAELAAGPLAPGKKIPPGKERRPPSQRPTAFPFARCSLTSASGGRGCTPSGLSLPKKYESGTEDDTLVLPDSLPRRRAVIHVPHRPPRTAVLALLYFIVPPSGGRGCSPSWLALPSTRPSVDQRLVRLVLRDSRASPDGELHSPPEASNGVFLLPRPPPAGAASVFGRRRRFVISSVLDRTHRSTGSAPLYVASRAGRCCIPARFVISSESSRDESSFVTLSSRERARAPLIRIRRLGVTCRARREDFRKLLFASFNSEDLVDFVRTTLCCARHDSRYRKGLSDGVQCRIFDKCSLPGPARALPRPVSGSNGPLGKGSGTSLDLHGRKK
ncbi:hypothetical protein THAOC_02473, partial [Thalassiosira oceanica]